MVRITIIITAITFALYMGMYETEQKNLHTLALLESNMDSISDEIQAMHDEVRPWLVFEPIKYIAFSDIDFDSIPEFFFGYQYPTSMQLNIWYRAFSLKNGAMIDCSHQPEWSIYLSEDTGCCFYSSASSFLEGYYQNENEEIVIVTQVEVGSLPSMQKEFCLIQYDGSTMLVNEDMAGIDEEYHIPLTPIKQVWVELQGDNLRDDILALLQDYNNL